MNRSADYWIEKLGLSEHPEGGYFARTYSSRERIAGEHLPERFGGSRAIASAIYYLLKGDRPSAFHRIKSDEMWHFYEGSSLTLHVIGHDGRWAQIHLGRDFERGEKHQALVKAGCWFGAIVDDPRSYALTGCTVAPGFEYEDMELADRAELIGQFPQHRAIIEKLTRG